MTYIAHVKNGMVVVDGGALLPEGAAVELRIITDNDDELDPDVLRFAGSLSPDVNIYEAHLERLRRDNVEGSH